MIKTMVKTFVTLLVVFLANYLLVLFFLNENPQHWLIMGIILGFQNVVVAIAGNYYFKSFTDD